MNFDLSDDARALGEQAERLLVARARPGRARKAMADGAPHHDASLWAEMVALGWPAARVPEAHGGLGLSGEESAVLAEAAGRHLACVPLLPVLLATEALLLAGSPEQQARWLPAIAQGQIIVPAWSEPGSVTPASVRCSASDNRLSGLKAPVADLGAAQYVIAAAAGPDGPSLWLVEAAAATVEPVQTLDLVRRHGRLRLDDTPAEPLGGADAYQQWLDRAAVLLAFEAMGTASAAMAMAVAYAKERSAFGQTIGRYQAVKHKCADMYIKLELARAHALHGLALFEGGPELRQAASAARVASLEALVLCVEENVQIHGGIGFTWESDCQFYYRRGRTLVAALGPGAFWTDRLVRALERRNLPAA